MGSGLFDGDKWGDFPTSSILEGLVIIIHNILMGLIGVIFTVAALYGTLMLSGFHKVR